MGLLVDGAKFEDGILAELPVSVEGQSPLDELNHLEAISTTFDTSSSTDAVWLSALPSCPSAAIRLFDTFTEAFR